MDLTLTPSQADSVLNAASKLGVDNPQWLFDLIALESGFDPMAENPRSSAKGLIQFLDSTARSLGYTSSLDLITKHPSVESQMAGPVIDYLQQWAPYDSEYDLYMAVFFPAARNYAPETPFKTIFKDLYGASADKRYNEFTAANPGIETPQDYFNLIKKNSAPDIFTKKTSLAVGLTVAALLGALYLKGKF